MSFLEQNIQGLCQRNGIDFQQFLSDFNIDNVNELSVFDLQVVAEENNLDLQSLLFQPLFKPSFFQDRISKIKLLILDIDGVMTDGGMYMMMNGDQMKKFNTKDGLGILELHKKGIEVAIISSGIYDVAVTKRAEMLRIKHCFVGRRPKVDVFEELKERLGINDDEAALIGDDLNDLELLQKVGFTACPNDAIPEIRNAVNVILQKKGGEGCVREFIDRFF